MTLPDDAPDEREMMIAWRRAINETRAVLKAASQTWARHSCPGTAECCQLKLTQKEPWLWPSEWKVLQAQLALEARPLPKARSDGACPFLDASGLRCTVYEARPFGCRTFFCGRIQGPTRLPAAQTNALLERLCALNLEADADAAPRSILTWHALTSSEQK